MAEPPHYGKGIPGAREGDPDYSTIVPPGETIIRITRPNPEAAGQNACRTMAIPLMFTFPPCICGLICYPCIYNTKWSAIEAAKDTVVILTDRALYMYVGDFPSCCCCTGCNTNGASTRSIPLERITNVEVRQPGSGQCNKFIKEVSVLAVETAGNSIYANGVSRPELMMAAGEDSEEFKMAVLQARSADRGGGARTTVVQAQPTSEGKRFKIRMNSNPDKVKIVVGEDLPQLLAAVKSKFGLDESTKLRLFLTEDRIEIEAFDELSANDNLTACEGDESLD